MTGEDDSSPLGADDPPPSPPPPPLGAEDVGVEEVGVEEVGALLPPSLGALLAGAELPVGVLDSPPPTLDPSPPPELEGFADDPPPTLEPALLEPWSVLEVWLDPPPVEDELLLGVQDPSVSP